jgi:hypothetical protein
MSVRARQYARLQSAGWTVITDSPWQRLVAAVARQVGLVAGLWRRGWSR